MRDRTHPVLNNITQYLWYAVAETGENAHLASLQHFANSIRVRQSIWTFFSDFSSLSTSLEDLNFSVLEFWKLMFPEVLK